ncbi:MAG: hypothetical protein QNL33_08755 [Akkermansiaceae bacterium]|jgi:hypothetical protein
MVTLFFSPRVSFSVLPMVVIPVNEESRVAKSVGYSPFFHGPVYDPFPRRYGYGAGYGRCHY